MSQNKNVSKTLPKMCLNMIVKNEAHIIEETLECISKYIDYYVISDTGSTDNTMEVITNFFNKKGIKGEIFQDVWEDDFSHNRTLALRECDGKSEYIWVIDADDIIVGDLVLPKKMDADAYSLTYGEGFTYSRLQIFKNSKHLNWKYIGVVHEYPDCDKHNYSKVHIDGNYYVDSRRLGDRSKDPLKYLRDAQRLEKSLLKNPDNERDVFYLAQSYYDYGDIPKGIEVYKQRIEMGRWYEEVFYSYFRIATGLEQLGKDWDEVEKAYLDAYNFCKIRGAEPLHRIAKHYREIKDFKKGYYWAKKASEIPFPTQCVLFIQKDVYDFQVLDELSIDAYWIGKYKESYVLCKKLLEQNLSEHDRSRVIQNLKFASDKLKELIKEDIVIYTGSKIVGYDDNFLDLIDTLHMYNIYLVGNRVDMSHVDHTNVYNITIDQFKHIKKNKKFKYVFLYDNINIIFNISLFKDIPMILWQSSDTFQLTLDNGVNISVKNEIVLNQLIKNLIKIICIGDEVIESLSTHYGIDKNNLININNNDGTTKLFNKKTITYNLKIKDNYPLLNGFDFIFPKYVYALNNNKELDPSEKYILQCFYNKLVTELPNRPEPFMYLSQYYLDHTNNFSEAVGCVEKALKAMNVINLDLGGYPPYYKDVLNIQKAKCYHEMKKYQDSYNLAQQVYNNNTLIVEKYGSHIEDVRDSNIDYIKDSFLTYPKDKINKLTNRKLNNSNKQIALSITTCKRLDLFVKTVNSFINCCEDIDSIGHFICVDDNSSEQDRAHMKKQYPFFTYIFKDESEKGHYVSMNKIHKYVTENNIQYLLHMEDDFHFISKRKYLSDAISILGNDQMIGQVLFNKNYAEVENFKKRCGGGIPKQTKNGLKFVEHEYYESGTEEYENYLKRNEGLGTNGYWPHFSFRPSVLRCSMLKDVGEFSNTPHFEMAYAYEYVAKKYKSVFFDAFCCIHIGKKTWEKSGTNSYNLNNTTQFSINNDISNLVNIKILSNNLDTWNKFKPYANKNLPFYERVEVKPTNDLNKDEIVMFRNTDYRRDKLSLVTSQLKIWRDFGSKYCLVLDENALLCDTFNTHLNEVFKYIEENNVEYLVLGYINSSNNENINNIEFTKIDKLNGKPLGYIISKSAVNKLIDILKENGINHVNHDNHDNNDNNDMYDIYDSIYNINNIDMYELTPSIISGVNCIVPIVPIALSNNVNNVEELEGYKFYSQMDSYAGDIKYAGDLSLLELKELSDNDPTCKGFNTSGWLKHTIVKEEDMCVLYKSTQVNQGLYVKI